MQSRDVPCRRSSLTLDLDENLWLQLEKAAATQLLSIDNYVRAAIQQALQNDMPRVTRKSKVSGAQKQAAAPLDAFLPVGVDPFAPSDVQPGLASSFEEVQARMRFAGTPSLLLGLG